MISNLSLSAFSATDLRPAASRAPDRVDGPGAPSKRPPVEPAPPIDRVRAQSEARSTLDLLTLGRTPPTTPSGKPVPRGSLLDLSV